MRIEFAVHLNIALWQDGQADMHTGMSMPQTPGRKAMPDQGMSLAGEFAALNGQVDPADFAPYWQGDPWSNNMSWPWLHETLFLQDYPGLGAPFPNLDLMEATPLNNSTWEPEVFAPTPVPTWSVPSPQSQQLMSVPDNNNNGMQLNHLLSGGTDGGVVSNSRLLPHLAPATNQSGNPRATNGPHPASMYTARGPEIPQAQQMQKIINSSGSGTRSPSVRMADPHQSQRAVVDELVNFAFDHLKANPEPGNSAGFWRNMSAKVEQAFDLYNICPTHSGGHHLLHHFVDLFFARFYPLWPLFRKQNFIYDRAPPHLFMTLASIGSMYAGEAAAAYGFLTHESIRIKLLVAPFQFQLAEDAYEPLCQSMLLIQVAALYFGHKQAFSIAQQLGSTIVSHARKINLFNNTLAFQNIERQSGRTPKAEEILSNWIRSEGRKRLAFGILRAEVFVGIILNTRPLVSYEEMNLELPCPSDVWSLDPSDLQKHVLNSYHLQEGQRGHLYSDLVRITMDKGEALPILSPAGFELLLFGLQQPVWRFSHDLALMPRLTGERNPEPFTERQNDLFASWSFSAHHVDQPEDEYAWASDTANGSTARKDLLDCSLRDMHDLKSDYNRTFLVLRKWKQSFAATTMSAEIVGARSSLLASRLLYHLSFLRLKADIHTFHLLAHKLVKGDPRHTSIQTFVHSVYRWAVSRDAKVALEHACAIWSLISGETERAGQNRARFNIAAHISLYHAAAVVWAFAGTHASITEASLDMGETHGRSSRDEFRIHQGNNAGLMNNFVALFKKITPAWITISSFTTTLSIMASRPFPLILSEKR